MIEKIKLPTKNNEKNMIISSKTTLIEKLDVLESILKNSVEHIVISLDSQGLVVACNKSAELAHGYSAIELIGTKISNLYYPCDDKFTTMESILEKVQQLNKWKGKIKCFTKNGLQQIYNIVLILDSSVKSEFTIIAKSYLNSDQIFQLEVSQGILKIKNKKLKEFNKKIIEVNRLKDEFLANMSHDLRTPLNGIIGFAEILHDGKVGPVSKEHKEYLEEILSNAQLLLLLINDILDLAKIESGKMEFYPEKVNLRFLMNDLKNIFNKIITDKKIKLSMNIDSKLEINIDPNKLKQVVYNLVSNAFKFSHKNGHVFIVAYLDSKTTFRLEIRDTGIGIQRKDIKRLFVEFQQLETGTTKKYQGTGLGLALTRRIVEAQGGRVGVESVLGEGSIFYVILPCNSFPGKHRDTKKLEEIASKKIPTILVIEEKSPERSDLVSLLNTKGYITKTADNVDDAIDQDIVAQASAIVFDFFISDIGKLKLLRAFRCKKPFQKAPALLITGIVNKVEFFGFKIHDFLVEPITAEELIAALKWSGASPYSHKKVFVIDNNKKILYPHFKILKKFGYESFYESDLEKALLFIETTRPDVLILNPFLESAKMSGLDFLYELRLTLKGRYMPIVITTLKTLDESEREHIKGIIQRVLLKKEGVANSLLDEITKQYPVDKPSKVILEVANFFKLKRNRYGK